MIGFLLWLLLFVISWPIALVFLVLYPFIWILMIPFRLVGITVRGVFELLEAMFTLPLRLLRGKSAH